MKQKFTKLTAALALLALFILPLTGWGQTTGNATVTWSEQSIGNGVSVDGTVYNLGDYFTVTCIKNNASNAPTYYDSGTAVRCYATKSTNDGNIITVAKKTSVTSTVYITKVEYDGTHSKKGTTSFTYSGSPTETTATTATYDIDDEVTTASATLCETGGSANGQFYFTSVKVDYTIVGGSTPPTPQTYTVTFDAGAGTFVGNTDFPNASNTVEAGTYNLPSATPATGFTFGGWALGENTYQGGTEYTVSSDASFVASYTQNGGGNTTTEHTYSFAGANNFYTDVALTTHPGSGSSNNVETIYYSDGSVFVASGNARYFSSASSGYFMLGKTSAKITLPTFDGYKITQVKVHTSGSVSSNVQVSIVSGSNTASAAQQWATNSDFTYDIASDYQTSALSLMVTNNYNSQFTSITLVCVEDTPSTDPSIIANNVEIPYDSNNGSIEFTIQNPVDGGSVTSAVVSNDTPSGWLSTGTINNSTTPGTVALSCSANTTNTVRTATVTLTYTYNTSETVTKEVTITQAAAPVIYTTIPDIFNAASSTSTDVNVAFGNWVVSGVSGSNAFVTDNNGNGFIIYKENHGFDVNDKLSGTVMGTPLKLYKGSAEFTNLLKTTSGLSASNDGTITVITNKTIADLGGVNTGAVITLNNLTYDGTNLSDGTNNNNIKPYNTLYSGMSFTAGKTYNVTGVYQQFDNTKEILPRSADDIEEVVITTPAIYVTPATVNAPSAETDGTLTVTYTAIETSDGASIYWFTDETCATQTNEPAWIAAEINSSLNVAYTIEANTGDARTAYMKVYGVDSGVNGVYSNLVTINQAKYVAEYATLPFSFDGGRADIPNTSGLTQEGLDTDYNSSPKLKFNSTGDWVLLKFNETPGTLTYDIQGNGFSSGSTSTFKVQTSTNGTEYTDLKTYTTLSTASESFDLDADVRYVKWIYTEKGATNGGNVALGNINLTKYAAPAASITVTPTSVDVDAMAHDGNLSISYENLNIADKDNFDVYFYESDGTTVADYSAWLDAEVVLENNVYSVYYTIQANTGSARTAYLKVYVLDEDAVEKYSELVTINQAAYVAPLAPTYSAWVLTSLASLTANDVFIIVGTDNDNDNSYAMPNDGGASAPLATSVTIENNRITSDVNANLLWTVSNDGSGYTFRPNGETSKLLYCIDNNNGLRIGTGSGTYSSTFVLADNGYLKTTVNSNDRYIGIYFPSTGNPDWRSYKLSGTEQNGNIYNQTFAFYKKVDALNIAGYGSSATDGWNLIASPVVENITPTAENGFVTSAFDLYRFNQSANKEWENWKSNDNGGAHYHFPIESGKGYLYASETATTLIFEGTPYAGNGTFALTYENITTGMEGVNLVGNPFNTTASVDREFYVMNADGNGIEAAATGRKVNPMEGIFVIAESTETNPTVTFTQASQSTGSNNSSSSVVMNLTQNRGSVVDRAIVRFGSNSSLPKFQLFENSTKLYVSQDGKDYAVVSAEAQGEMPVNFKAAVDGSYTISVATEGIEANYLHLIDNITGMDVDLLQTPSYTFNARQNDYASRFRLVFSANSANENNSDSFAFISNGQIILTNVDNDATVQVIDALGRMIVSTNANNHVYTDNMAPGVYVLRLVNGNDVKTQKIVVK